jgi:NAD-dependent dihydropyrimidine dehydrogenase PreA subunit
MNEHKTTPEDKYAQWKGIPRAEIVWHPTIDETKCVGCGMCVTTCGRDVFGFDAQNKKAVVARPLQCMVGCSSCETWCVFEAISFPDRKRVRDFIKDKNILATARKQLAEKLTS